MIHDIFSDVVANDVCIGCGACAAVQPGALQMVWSNDGFFMPERIKTFDADLAPSTLAVCPFNNDGVNEDRIAEIFYGTERNKRDKYIGYYKKCFIGYCSDSAIRDAATSGGIIAWAIRRCLSQSEVDCVLAVGKSQENEKLFAFRKYHCINELDAPMKSRYYPSEFSTVLQQVIDEPGRVLFVGLPCQVKALRKVGLRYPEVAKRIRYTISLFCGHQKSRYYANYLSIHLGIDPKSVIDIDFRKKRAGKPAHDYGFEITYMDSGEIRKKEGITRDIFASSWSNNLFMNPACEFCDDMVGETADLSVGDAWLPRFSADSLGTSICVVRNSDILKAIRTSQGAGELMLEETDPATVYQCQEGGFRQKREMLQYRLFMAAKRKRIIPKKRVKPSTRGIGFFDRQQQSMRMMLRKISNKNIDQIKHFQDLASFRQKIRGWHLISEVIVILRRLKRKIKHLLKMPRC